MKAEAVAEEPFAHPGILTSQAELAVIQQRVAAADPADPTFAGYRSTLATRFADLTFVPSPAARPQRGDRKPKDSPSLERESAMTAYTLTLQNAIFIESDTWTHADLDRRDAKITAANRNGGK